MDESSGLSIVYNVLIVLGTLLLLFSTFFIVRQKTAVVIERLGKYHHVARAGLQVKIPLVDRRAGTVNLKVRELPVEVETKTKDDVFVKMVVSVQYYVVDQLTGIKDSFYQLDNPDRQIQSYVFDSIRSEVPSMELDETFAEKDKIALAVKKELSATMRQFGFDFIKALVTDIDPDQKVKHSMNEINAAKRMKMAAREVAEGEKIRVVAAAEAEAESKRLQGEGIANQRTAIANGLKRSVEEVRHAMDTSVTSKDVMNMLFMTQHYDTISRLGEHGVNTIFVPYSPDSVGALQTQIQASMLGVDAVQKTTEYNDSAKPSA